MATLDVGRYLNKHKEELTAITHRIASEGKRWHSQEVDGVVLTWNACDMSRGYFYYSIRLNTAQKRRHSRLVAEIRATFREKADPLKVLDKPTAEVKRLAKVKKITRTFGKYLPIHPRQTIKYPVKKEVKAPIKATTRRYTVIEAGGVVISECATPKPANKNRAPKTASTRENTSVSTQSVPSVKPSDIDPALAGFNW